MRQSGTVTSDSATLADCLAGYARRLHAVFGDRHHVASPLGAWLLLALCGPAAAGADRDALSGVLGCDVETAARLAAGLLARPHPVVAAAAALWTQPGAPPPAGFDNWRAGLPPAVQTGDLPGQAELDAWARDHTFGLIDRFPLQVDPAAFLVLATALATKVSWERPFDLTRAADLGHGSPWARRVRTVLRTPDPAGSAHRQFIAITPETGDVAVHLAQARDGLLVASVAAAADAPCADVLAVAQRIGTACAAADGGDDGVPRRRLADLPLGEAPLWRIREETVHGISGADRYTAVLPAWTAHSTQSLTAPELGFGAAVRAIAGGVPWDAAQAAMARYSRTGFEAAAVTGVALMAAMPGGMVRRRAAELRFAHPYAAVAVAVGRDADGGGAADPWRGVPVFSAWVADPQDAADDEPGESR